MFLAAAANVVDQTTGMDLFKLGDYLRNLKFNNWHKFFIDKILDISFVKDIITNQGNQFNSMALMFNWICILSFYVFIFVVIFEMFKLVILNQGGFSILLIKMLIVSILLSCYFPTIGSCINGINTFVNMSLKSPLEQKGQAITEKLMDTFTNVETYGETIAKTLGWQGEDYVEKTKNTISKMIGNFITTITGYRRSYNMIMETWIALTEILTTIVIAIVINFRNIYLILTVFMGPFAILCILLPRGNNYFLSWLRNFLYIIAWPIVIGFIFVLQDTLITNIFPTTTNPNFPNASLAIVNLAHFMGLFLMLAMSFNILPSMFNGVIGISGSIGSAIGTAYAIANLATRAISRGTVGTSNQFSGNNPNPSDPNPPPVNNNNSYYGGAKLEPNKNLNHQQIIESDDNRQRGSDEATVGNKSQTKGRKIVNIHRGAEIKKEKDSKKELSA